MKNELFNEEPPPNDDPDRCHITSDGRQCRRRKHPAGESCDFINEAAKIVPAGGSFFGHHGYSTPWSGNEPFLSDTHPIYRLGTTEVSAEEFARAAQVRIAELEEELREANEDRARLQRYKDGHGQ